MTKSEKIELADRVLAKAAEIRNRAKARARNSQHNDNT